jgi:hypothetical protein
MSAITKSYTVTRPLAIRRLGLHFLEMCVVMCPSGVALNLAVFGALGALGITNVTANAPEIGIMIVAINFAIVMAVYMKLRRHPTQHNLEMSGTAILGGLLFIVALWAGVLSRAGLQTWMDVFRETCGPICGLMLLVMIVRFDHYGGRVGAVVAASAAGEYTCPMHPEVRQAGPGRCPACGMNLVRRST